MPVSGRPRNPRGQRPLRFRSSSQDQSRPNERQASTDGESPARPRFHDDPHVPVVRRGETPGTLETEAKVKATAAGTIRRLWRQAVGYIGAPPPFAVSRQPATLTRALRYKTSTLYRAAGTDNTRFGAVRPYIEKENIQLEPTLQAGRKQNSPTVRNRLTSFGSRVTPLGAEDAGAA